MTHVPSQGCPYYKLILSTASLEALTHLVMRCMLCLSKEAYSHIQTASEVIGRLCTEDQQYILPVFCSDTVPLSVNVFGSSISQMGRLSGAFHCMAMHHPRQPGSISQ